MNLKELGNLPILNLSGSQIDHIKRMEEINSMQKFHQWFTKFYSENERRQDIHLFSEEAWKAGCGSIRIQNRYLKKENEKLIAILEKIKITNGPTAETFLQVIELVKFLNKQLRMKEGDVL